MRIDHPTSTQLWIRVYPIATWLVGMALASIGLIVLGSYFIDATSSIPTGLISDTTLGSLFAALGILILIRGRILRACFDKQEATLTITRQGVFRTETEIVPLFAIESVRLDPPQADRTQYQVMLVLAPHLTRSVTLYAAPRRQHPQAIAESVATFLGVETDIPPGFTDLLQGLWQSVRPGQPEPEPEPKSIESQKP